MAGEKHTRSSTSMPLSRAYVVTLVLSAVVFLLFRAVYSRLWGHAAYLAVWNRLYTAPFVAALLGGLLVHEALHGVGLVVFGRVPPAALRFGFQWLPPAAFCTTDAAIEAHAYRKAALTPAVLLGLLPLLVALMANRGGLALWSVIMLVTCGSDFAAIWAMRSVPRGARVVDSPVEAGCVIVPE